MSEKQNLDVIEKDEIKKIFPAYDQMVAQIVEFNEHSKEVFEKEKKEDGIPSRNEWLENEQTYNYISILGKRGSGKTSVIRTLMNEICSDDKNIVLPMIIPEKMSSASTLMSTILGMFKNVVERLSKKNNNECCWDVKKDKLSEKYQELLKKYCYICPEYRKILIDQYTSEHNYIDKSSEIFDSDSEFINCFNSFIFELIKTNCENEDKNKDKDYHYPCTIFIVIDDIDLCAEHCSDIVNTLLAYLGNPHIVTILSGDFDIFTETLVHDFLKRDNLLYGDLLDKRFSDYDSVLESRKKLAFEYLKKIMPPVYRYNVRFWSVKERWSFKSKKSKGKTLLDLLRDEVFDKYSISQMFYYYDINEKKESPMIQMFHLFDDTSRGLENVCNVLLNTIDILKKTSDTKSFSKTQQILLLLESIVYSNSNLNRYSNVIFQNIVFNEYGNNDAFINCMNTINLMNEIEKSNSSYKGAVCFTIYIFIEFGIRLLEKNDIKTTDFYKEVRKRGILYLINFPGYNTTTQQYKNEIVYPKLDENYLKFTDTKKAFLYFIFENDIEISTTLALIMANKRQSIKSDIFSYINQPEKNTIENIPFDLCSDVIESIKKTSSRLNEIDIVKCAGEIIWEYSDDWKKILISLIFEPLFNKKTNSLQNNTQKTEEKYERKLIYNTILHILKDGEMFDEDKIFDINKYCNKFQDKDQIILAKQNEIWNEKSQVIKKIKNKVKRIIKELREKGIYYEGLEELSYGQKNFLESKLGQTTYYVLNNINLYHTKSVEKKDEDDMKIYSKIYEYQTLIKDVDAEYIDENIEWVYLYIYIELKNTDNFRKMKNHCEKISELVTNIIRFFDFTEKAKGNWILYDEQKSFIDNYDIKKLKEVLTKEMEKSKQEIEEKWDLNSIPEIYYKLTHLTKKDNISGAITGLTELGKNMEIFENSVNQKKLQKTEDKNELEKVKKEKAEKNKNAE